MFGIWIRKEQTPEENCTKASYIHEAEAHGNVQHAKFLRSIRGPSPVLNEPPYVKMSDFRWNIQRFYNHNHPDLSNSSLSTFGPVRRSFLFKTRKF